MAGWRNARVGGLGYDEAEVKVLIVIEPVQLRTQEAPADEWPESYFQLFASHPEVQLERLLQGEEERLPIE